jgi:hypothetical protein
MPGPRRLKEEDVAHKYEKLLMVNQGACNLLDKLGIEEGGEVWISKPEKLSQALKVLASTVYPEAYDAQSDDIDLDKLHQYIKQDALHARELLKESLSLEMDVYCRREEDGVPQWIEMVLDSEEGAYGVPDHERFEQLLEESFLLIRQVHQVLNGACHLALTGKKFFDMLKNDTSDGSLYATIFFNKNGLTGENGEDPKLTELQELAIFLLNTTNTLGLKRYNDKCYSEIKIDTQHTLAWKPVCTISRLIDGYCSRETNAKEWLLLTKRAGMRNDLHTFMCTTLDIQFQDIVPDRHLFSFNNGLLVCKPPSSRNTDGDLYGPPRQRRRMDSRAAPRFIPYDRLPHHFSKHTSSKFFDMPFDPAWIVADLDSGDGPMGHLPQEVMDIPTPYLDKILTDQDMDADTRAFVYCFMGRMIFEVGEYDNWQCMPYYMGAAGTGKSTLIGDVVIKFYDDADQVYCMGNNVERKFGMQNALTEQSTLKLLVAMPEVKQDLQLEQVSTHLIPGKVGFRGMTIPKPLRRRSGSRLSAESGSPSTGRTRPPSRSSGPRP